ncbi:hypothetical protein [Arcicella rigui]|uniref:Alpha/beta hydrolase n=1 Tax=Arcicella rigui TaxID=797020 RepID=A0ABU5QEH0_9BACT|nr:hypothetical protein [Arcicella rigui]MEA5141113.1 hypothetical protein [Arcicella rigui]
MIVPVQPWTSPLVLLQEASEVFYPFGFSNQVKHSIIPNTGHGGHNENFPATWASILPFLKN